MEISLNQCNNAMLRFYITIESTLKINVVELVLQCDIGSSYGENVEISTTKNQ